MEIKELYLLIKSFYGYKIRELRINTKEKSVEGLLYDSFFLECNINDRYGRFGAGIDGGEYFITEFMGKHCLLNCDKRSIKQGLELIDCYCRSRLPDKFLDEYDRNYKRILFSL